MQPKPLALRILDIVAIILLGLSTYFALNAPTGCSVIGLCK